MKTEATDTVYTGIVQTVKIRRCSANVLATVFAPQNSFAGFALGYTYAHNLRWRDTTSPLVGNHINYDPTDMRAPIYEGELFKVGENLKVKTQRHAQVFAGLLVYSGAWSGTASNIPLDKAQVFNFPPLFTKT